MAYERINWQNESSGNTPLSAENLNHMEDGIAEAIQRIDNHLAIYVNGVAYPISMISQQTVQGVEGFLITIDLGNNQETTYFVADGIGLNTVKAAIEAQIPDAVIVDSGLSGTSTNPVQNSAIVTALTGKLNAPAGGTAGQVLQKTADGARWADVGTPSQEQIYQAVTAYIADHPGSLSPLSPAVKVALLQIAEKVAYIDENGEDYYDALNEALNASAVLSITAVFTQGSAVIYDTDTLESLKQYLVVTAYYDDSTTANVTALCTLSGTLTGGTSVITASYSGKTATFEVEVTSVEYVTDGLIVYFDGINNTSNGHSNSAIKWTDLVNGYEFDIYNTADPDWEENCLNCDGTGNVGASSDATLWTRPQYATIEFVFKPESTASKQVAMLDASDTASGGYYQSRRILLFNDSSINFIGNSAKSYPVSALTDLRKVVATYNDFTILSAYANGSRLSVGSATHSWRPMYRTRTLGNGEMGNAQWAFNGKIYAIRIYNRVLTDEEIAQNLRYDNHRFNLGLTL